MATIVFSRMDSETSPAGAYLYNSVTWLQIQFFADGVEFVNGSFFDRGIFAGVNCRRVHHGRVEEGLEQIVAQIVMGADVLSRTVFCVAVKPVQSFERWFGHPTELVLKLVHAVNIARKEPKQRNEIR